MLIHLPTNADLNALIAALALYRNEGMGEPMNRPEDIHALACGMAPGMHEDISLDASGLETLRMRLMQSAAIPLANDLVHAAQALTLAAAAVLDADEAGDAEAQSDEWAEATMALAKSADAVTAALNAPAPADFPGTVPVPVWLVIEDDGGSEPTVQVFGTQAEADKAWEEHASELWREHCGRKKMPLTHEAICAGLEAAGCTDWKVTEQQTIRVPVPVAPPPAAPALDDRELAVVLAGLRLLQERRGRSDFSRDIAAIEDSCGGVAPLADAEIDRLCERLNCGGAPAPADSADTEEYR